jgi:hypothetical protein
MTMSNESEFDKAIEEQETDLNRRNRAVRRRNMMILGLAVAALLFALICLFLAMDNQRLAASNATFAQQQQVEKKEIAKEAGKALCGEGDRQIYDKELCAWWADAAGEPTIAPSAPAVPLGGPSQADLVQAFREYCADGNCKGQDGAPPTADDIAAAFVAFCADGRCTGPAGKDAPRAEDGKDGQSLPPSGEMVLAAVTTFCGTTGACVGATGADGPPPTAEAVLAAVQQVCANDACVGPMGPAGADSTVPGPEGKQGEPGRGLQSQFCGDDRRWLITYTDGTTQDGGVCREDPGPPIGALP